MTGKFTASITQFYLWVKVKNFVHFLLIFSNFIFTFLELPTQPLAFDMHSTSFLHTTTWKICGYSNSILLKLFGPFRLLTNQCTPQSEVAYLQRKFYAKSTPNGSSVDPSPSPFLFQSLAFNLDIWISAHSSAFFTRFFAIPTHSACASNPSRRVPVSTQRP